MRGARLGYVDTIRGLAALAVIYFHIADHLLKTGQVESAVERVLFGALTQSVDLGKVAVVMFFAVSGFVVPYSLDVRSRTPVRDFAIGRFFRLYPAYWLSIPMGICAFYIALGRDLPVSTVLANLTMLQQFVGIENIIGLYWTLQIELIFYGLCVLLFCAGLLMRTRGLVGAAVVMLAAAVLMALARHHLGKALPVALPLALAIMLWGTLWRRWHVEGQAQARGAALGILTLIALAIPVISVLAYGRDLGFGETWYRYTATYWVALLLFALMTTRCRIEAPLLAWLGAVSYGLYLFGPIAQAMVFAAARWAGLVVPGHALIAAAMLVALAIAAPVHRFVERPCIRLGRRLIAESGIPKGDALWSVARVKPWRVALKPDDRA
ncbi:MULTISPECIES: acyltransferase family protein [unclassified Methylobacterium]|jgi:peptidoglycan/LPS O-acetylase OafA/YrhL|uniref:acyltransferase family protein n=1 Tax=unclassified Methylobacterium TaxID=2615210 RepID=UPI00135564CD|nr:acyltransferase [Methylobacterium sp. 2A]MWV22512.1 acyltransferase [Methylobacterium sp. 2A]